MINKSVFLSVIIPVYNVEKYLEICIESILSQEFKDYEVILINDGSTDRSGEICNYYAERYSNIKVKHIKNLGVSNARNVGIKLANGEYIHFMDSDDTIDSNMYKDFSKIVSQAKYDIIISGIKYNKITKGEIIKVHSGKKYKCKSYEEIGMFLKNLSLDDKEWALNVIWNKWIKREVIISNNIFFNTGLSLGEDFIFVTDIFKNIKSLYVEDLEYYNYFLRGEESLVNKFHGDIITRRPMILNAHRTLYEYYGVYHEYKKIIDYNEGRLTFHGMLSINNINCKLNLKEKKKFIKSIISSPHYFYVLNYLNQKSGVKNKLINMIFRSKNSVLIYNFINMVNKI